MQGIPLDTVSQLRAATMKQLIVAGAGRIKLSGPKNLAGFQRG
jgi:hypothetical protein